LITLIVIIVVAWALIRIVQFVTRLWRGADAAGSARIGVVEAA
jgi:ABC-type cobalt transport system substrate-binding protein